MGILTGVGSSGRGERVCTYIHVVVIKHDIFTWGYTELIVQSGKVLQQSHEVHDEVITFTSKSYVHCIMLGTICQLNPTFLAHAVTCSPKVVM